MVWIQNVSFADIIKAHHFDPGPNSLLIQIVDPDTNHPKAKFPFLETAKFKFLDIEEEDINAIQLEDAKQIALRLQQAKKKNQNVIVHCHAGICRSGAVVEAGISIGFQDTETHRSPNLRVKRMLMHFLHPDSFYETE